jgi:aminoglycoside phosphotransferase (APT) family kinase protein
MLAATDVVDYLLGQHLLTAADVVLGGVVIDDLSRRNRNFAIRTHGGSGFMVKQSDARLSTKTIDREADVYRLLWATEAEFATRHTPRLRRFDPDHELLVLDFLESTEPVSAARGRDPDVVEGCAVELGRALGRLHGLPLPEIGGFEAPPPWVYFVARPSANVLVDFSGPSLSAIKIAQQSGIFRGWVSDSAWVRDGGSWIHGDIRFDNCLVRVPEGATGPEAIFLVDWELAGIGDPCWDVGAVFSEHLMIWLRSMPLAPSLSLRDSLALAEHPLQTVLPSLGAFWRSYQEQRGDVHQRAEFLLRSVESAGARLIQSAVESAQASQQLTSTVVYTLQLAENILANPREAAERLLGLQTA